jgi:hypothetical protein
LSRAGATGSGLRLPHCHGEVSTVAYRAPRGTLCLVIALARHGLTDIIPPRIDIALPRGSRIPALRTAIDVRVFARETKGRIGRL